jgi:hypothetical protein
MGKFDAHGTLRIFMPQRMSFIEMPSLGICISIVFILLLWWKSSYEFSESKYSVMGQCTAYLQCQCRRRYWTADRVQSDAGANAPCSEPRWQAQHVSSKMD